MTSKTPDSYYHGAGFLPASTINIALIAILMMALAVTLIAIKKRDSIMSILASGITAVHTLAKKQDMPT